MNGGNDLCKSMSAIAKADAEFWRLHAEWRQLEDDFEAYPYDTDESEIACDMLDKASEARDRMFLCPVTTAAALVAKLEVCEEGCVSGVIDQDLPGGETVFGRIKRDSMRLAALEVERATGRGA